MEAIRRTRSRASLNQRTAKDTFAETIITQLIASAAVLILFWIIITAGAFLRERAEISGLLKVSADFNAVYDNIKTRLSGNDEIMKVWKDLTDKSRDEIEETPPVSAAVSGTSGETDPLTLSKYVDGYTYSPPVIGIITSYFGDRTDPFLHDEQFHTGVDIASDEGDGIVAAADGRVIFARELGGYGNAVKILHPNGLVSLYAHCSQLLVAEGDYVKEAQLIARIGSTGRSTGAHLHFEIIDGESYIDPLKLIENIEGRSA